MISARIVVKRVLIGAIIGLALVYLGDTLSVWYRMSKKIAGDPLTTMNTQPVIEIPHKDGQAEIVLGQAQTQTCVRSIFPHDGYSPCWFVARQNQSPIVMTLLPLRPRLAGSGIGN
jgi:hypothetical protein